MGPVPGTPPRAVLFRAAVRSACVLRVCVQRGEVGCSILSETGEAIRWGWIPGGKCLSRGSCPPLSLPGGKHKSVNFAYREAKVIL